MKSFLCRAAVPAALILFGATLSAEPASTAAPQAPHAQHAERGEHADHTDHMNHQGHTGHGSSDQKADAQPATEAKEAERVCRHVKLDMSSRRKTKLCKTADEWREFNQPR